MSSKNHAFEVNEYFKHPEEFKIAIIGLGYVVLALAIEFAKKYQVLGFDINEERVQELAIGKDRTQEGDLNELLELSKNGGINSTPGIKFSANENELKNYNIFIVSVPTPISRFKSPDLSILLNASEMIGKILKKHDIIIYESTVYPGCTEEDCVPILENLQA